MTLREARAQLRSQGLSSYCPMGPVRWETLGSRLVSAKISSRYFFQVLLQSDNKSLVSEMHRMGLTAFVSEIKRVENYSDIENLSDKEA